MAKIRNLSEIQQEIAFTEFDFYQKYAKTFKTSELGRFKSLLPFREMAQSFNLIEEHPMHKRGKSPSSLRKAGLAQTRRGMLPRENWPE